ncbi:MAG TPA: hypothetical protein VNK95_20190 [Caldilineaceae bacterium]|nr:hypothetical protein [Caldilineaceae bacterium]
MSELALSQILGARLRLTLAQMHLPGPLRAANATLIAWLDSLSVGPALVGPGQELAAPRLDFEAAITAAFDRLTWRAAGPSALMIPAMQGFFNQVGADEDALARLADLGGRLDPHRLGVWVEASDGDMDGGVDAGWYLPEPLPLDVGLEAARALSPENPKLTQLQAWAEAAGAQSCERLGRSVAPGSAFSEIRIVLPGSGVDEWVLAGVRLMEALRMPALPDDALGALLNAETGQMLASLWLTATGVAKAGLLAAAPSLELTLSLFRLATGARQPEDYTALAAWQGNLDVDGPSWIECQQRAGGFGVELHYHLH